MSRSPLFVIGKFLEAAGLIVVLFGFLASVSAGAREDGLSSMAYEFRGLMLGGGLFLVGWLIESRAPR